MYMRHYFIMIVDNFARFLFICYLAASQPTLGHFCGDSLSNKILINGFLLLFDLKAFLFQPGKETYFQNI